MLNVLNKIDSAKVFQFYLSTLLMVFGTDKFFNFLAYWPSYLAPQIIKLTNIDPVMFMYIVGVFEFAAGILLWLNARFGGLLSALLLIGISVSLIISGKNLNIAFIDIALAICAAALAQSQSDDGPQIDSTF